ncbi:MAG TPA: glycosyl hydrolase family 18 protein [Candidatus Limnocylindrales bacterium]|nr:glycosyl hydrolase family 18 protein [Candidatus Limnocylindrales bacterium]
MRRRALVPGLLAAGVVVVSIALTGLAPQLDSDVSASPSDVAQASEGPGGEATVDPAPTPRPPLGGNELYGFLPYWQMTDAVANHLRTTPVTTLALFSVTSRRSGELNDRPQGYRRITGAIGRRLIREAHDRGARVELVFTSFGATRNGRLFGRLDVQPAVDGSPVSSAGAGSSGGLGASGGLDPGATAAPAPWRRTVEELVDLAADLGVDGINVDVEQLDPADREAYHEFLAVLRAKLRDRIAKAEVSVATEAGERGIGNAAVAASAGVDRLFLMGYDYHWSGSPPGASSPVDRADGVPTLRWSIGRYVEAGVPREKMLLGLPLYGMTWRTLGPGRSFPVIGNGIAWLPHQNLDTLSDPAFAPTRDDLELAEWFVEEDGDEWLLTYYDSPETLRPKLALARDQGLAGGGFWALGYDRGLPGYGKLMRDFVAGDVKRDEAPPLP